MEASAACQAWIKTGVNHTYRYHYSEVEMRLERQMQWWPGKRYGMMRPPGQDVKPYSDKTIYSRRCRFEEDTNQFLGLESNTVKSAKKWDQSLPEPEDWKVTKHFRY